MARAQQHHMNDDNKRPIRAGGTARAASRAEHVSAPDHVARFSKEFPCTNRAVSRDAIERRCPKAQIAGGMRGNGEGPGACFLCEGP